MQEVSEQPWLYFKLYFPLILSGPYGITPSADLEKIMLNREEDQQMAMEAVSDILPVIYAILEEAVAFYFSDAY